MPGTLLPYNSKTRVFDRGHNCRLFTLNFCCIAAWQDYFISKALDEWFDRREELRPKAMKGKLTQSELDEWETPFDPFSVDVTMIAVEISITTEYSYIPNTIIFSCADYRSDAERKKLNEGFLSKPYKLYRLWDEKAVLFWDELEDGGQSDGIAPSGDSGPSDHDARCVKRDLEPGERSSNEQLDPESYETRVPKRKHEFEGVKLNSKRLIITDNANHCLDYDTNGIQTGDDLVVQLERITKAYENRDPLVEDWLRRRIDHNRPEDLGIGAVVNPNPSRNRGPRSRIDILGNDVKPIDLAEEYDPTIPTFIDIFWAGVNPAGHRVEHHVDNHEAGPSNQLALRINDARMLAHLANNPDAAQACLRDLRELGQHAVGGAVILLSIFRSTGSTDNGKGAP